MKVCLVSAYFAPQEIGGAERAARMLAESLAARGWEVVVLASWPHDETIILPSGLKVHHLRTGPAAPRRGAGRWIFRLRNVWNAAAYRKVRAILAAERPQLVNVHNFATFSPAVFAAARSLSLPLVFTAHDYFPLCRHYSFERNGQPCPGHCLACRLWSRWNRRYLERTPAVYLSDYSRRLYRRHVRAPRVLVLPNAVDLSEAQIAAHCLEKEAFRRQRPPPPVTWLFLGRLDSLKGIRTVMHGWERAAVPGSRLRIAGDGPLRAEVLRWAERRPEVEVLGVVSGASKHRALISADGLLLPTRATDVSPLVVPEALGYGVPVLGGDAGALPELIQPGVTGWLCDVSDADAFGCCLARVSLDPASLRSMAGGCFAAAREKTCDRLLPRIMEYYERLAVADGLMP